MIRRAILAIALTCAAPVAQANPPEAWRDQIMVADRLIAFSDGHVFVLRQSDDNLGHQNAIMRKVALVAIDRKTGNEQIWPAMRISVQHDPGREDLHGSYQRAELPDAVDPFAKLDEMGGYTIPDGDSLKPISLNIAPNIGRSGQAIRGFSLPNDLRFEADPRALRISTSRSLDLFGKVMGDYPRHDGRNDAALLTAQDFTDTRCFFGGRFILDDSETAPPVHLVNVGCTEYLSGPDGKVNVHAAIWVVVPPEPRE